MSDISASGGMGMETCEEQNERLRTRIAELEAEVARLAARDNLGPYKLIHPDHLAGLDARIAELKEEVERLRNDGAGNRYWEGRWRDEKSERDRLKEALRPFARLTKVEQARTDVIAENDLITVVVRVGDITAARAALSGEENP